MLVYLEALFAFLIGWVAGFFHPMGRTNFIPAEIIQFCTGCLFIAMPFFRLSEGDVGLAYYAEYILYPHFEFIILGVVIGYICHRIFDN